MEYKYMVGMKAKNLNRKAFLLLAMLLAGGVASAQVVVKGSVYGGGQGIETDEKAGLVTGNATVTMNGGTVERSIYGGGELGSVGTFIEYTPFEYDGNLTVNVPKRCAQGTGLATVTVNGGHVGKNGSLMGVNPEDDDRGWIFCGGRGEADSITYPKAIALGTIVCAFLNFLVAADFAKFKKAMGFFPVFMLLIAVYALVSMYIWVTDFSEMTSISRAGQKILFQTITIIYSVFMCYLLEDRAVHCLFFSLCASPSERRKDSCARWRSMTSRFCSDSFSSTTRCSRRKVRLRKDGSDASA